MIRIPEELLGLKQWVSFSVETVDGLVVKTPFIPGTTTHASPTDKSHWRCYEEAAEHGHPAFTLTKHDPYVFIDFDILKPLKGESASDLQKRQDDAYTIWQGIENTFVSYMERSVSGKGVHIFGRGALSGAGSQRKEYGLELYDRGRFVIFTGDPILDAPISEFPAEDLLRFEKWMRKEGAGYADLDPHQLERPERFPDEIVIQKACALDRVPILLRGDWESLGYKSQSEADFDLMAELFRACHNTEQVKRIFQQTPLYRSSKVWDYVERATLRIKQEQLVVDREIARMAKGLNGHPKPAKTKPATPPPVKITTATEEPVAGDYLEEPKESFQKLVEELPSGLLRDMVDAFYCYGHFPLFEGSLVGALNVAHCTFSRAFQTSTGLALKGWTILVGPTTCGKEIATQGPQALFRATQIPSVFDMLRGEPRSEQGLFRMVSETPRMLINMDECAAWVKSMCDPKAPACAAALREALTKLYSKGDNDGIFLATNRSEKNALNYVERPCVSIFGDSQDGNIYAGLTTDQIATGFLPRFVFVDVNYDTISEDSQESQPFTKELVGKVRDALRYTGLWEAQNNKPFRVPVEPVVAEKLKAYELKLRRRLFKNKPGEGPAEDQFKMLHSRSAAKVGIYMALLAVCANWKCPRVTMEHYEWARRFVDFCTENTIQNLNEGGFSSDTKEQRRAVMAALARAIDMTEEARRDNHYFTSDALVETPHAVPLAWLRNSICRKPCFTNDRRDIGTCLTSVLKELQEDGLYTVLAKEESHRIFRARCPVICQLTEDYWQGRDEEEDEV